MIHRALHIAFVFLFATSFLDVPLSACQKCCAGKVANLSVAEALSLEEMEDLRSFFLNHTSIGTEVKFQKLKRILEIADLDAFNAEHVRLIYQQLLSPAPLESIFRMEVPLKAQGTAAIVDKGTKLNLSVANIQILKQAYGPSGEVQMVPLGYGERPESLKQAGDLITDFIFAFFRLVYEVARYYPELKTVSLSALSIQGKSSGGNESPKYFLLRLLENKLGFEEVRETHPGAANAIVYGTRVIINSRPEAWANKSFSKPRVLEEGATEEIGRHAEELMKTIRARLAGEGDPSQSGPQP